VLGIALSTCTTPRLKPTDSNPETTGFTEECKNARHPPCLPVPPPYVKPTDSNPEMTGLCWSTHPKSHAGEPASANPRDDWLN